MPHPAGAMLAAAPPPPRAALCSHFRIHGMSNWMPLYMTTASQWWRSAATSRFIDATASRERVCSAQKTLKQRCSRSARAAVSYTTVPMTVISCRWCEKPVVSISSSSSSIRRAARTCRLYKRCAGPRGKQDWRGPGSSGGAGGPSTPFSSRLPHSIPNACGASTPTTPRASDRRSSDNETQALPKRQSQDVADSSGRHEAQVRGDDVHARKHSPGRNWIGSRTRWLASWWWRLRSPRQARPGSPLRTCRPWSIAWISRTASPASHSRPHSTAYNGKDERQARTGKGAAVRPDCYGWTPDIYYPGLPRR